MTTLFHTLAEHLDHYITPRVFLIHDPIISEIDGDNVSNVITETLYQLSNSISLLMPKLLTALIILIAGYAVAKILSLLIISTSTKIGLQRIAQQIGLADSMKQAKIKRNLPEIVGLIVFWLILCITLMTCFNIFQLEPISSVLLSVVRFFPKIFIALAIIVIGTVIAKLLYELVATSAEQFKLSHSTWLATACYWTIILIVYLTALQQLNIQLLLAEQLILIVFCSLALGIAIAFGMGGKEAAGSLIAGYLVRQRFQTGDSVRVEDLEGIIREIGSTATLIETEEKGLLHRYRIANQKMLDQAIG